MKTVREWQDQLIRSGPLDQLDKGQEPWFIEAIQRDALSDPMAQTTAEQERQFGEAVEESQERKIERLEHNIEVYKARWHEARRYLRAANKGAERNNQVMRLQACDIAKLLDRIKHLEQQLNDQ